MLALARHRMNFILNSLDKNILATYQKCRFLAAIFGALSCISISAPKTLANETTTSPNPINEVERKKIMEAQLTWKKLQPFVHNFVGMNREQVAASIGKPKFVSSSLSDDDTEGYEVENDEVLQLLYRRGRIASYEFVLSKDAQRFNLHTDNSGPHYEPSIRPEGASELELKRQKIFESNMPNLMGVSKAQVHKLFGQSRMSPRFNSSLEFDCKTGILSFTFEQNKVIKFGFRTYDIEQIITPPPPAIEAVN